MNRALASVFASLVLAAPVLSQEPPVERQPPAEPQQPKLETKTVKVTAEGYNRDDALKRALRKALEQGAGVQIAAYSNVRDFQMIRDTIYSRASGIVTEFRVLSEEKGAGGTIEITIEATVRPDTVARTWGEVQNVLDQIGRPKIMVWIEETIDSDIQKESVVAARIEEMFTKAGFDLVNRQAVEDIAHREHADALREGNAAKLAALAKDAGAHILIRGSANANRAGIRDIYGVKAAYYNCDVQARMYMADSGRMLASESLPQTSAGVRSHREFSPQAARVALVQATFPDGEYNPAAGPTPLAIRVYESVMAQWSTIISAGGDIDLEIEGIEFKGYLAIKNALAEIDGLKSADGDFTKGIAKFRIKALMSAETLAEKLTEKPFEQWLEVLDLKPGRIQCKAAARPTP